MAASTYNTTVTKFLLVIALVFFLEMLFVNIIGYVGIILGHRYNHGKIVKSIIISFLLYIVTQVITLGLIFVCGLFDKGIMNMINTTSMIEVGVINKIMFIAIIIYIIYIIFYYLLGKLYFEKGVDID